MTKRKANNESRLGIVDWGIGGVGIYKALRARLGDVSVVYFSDTGAKPYGKMAGRELALRLSQVVEFLQIYGVSRVLFACNAASTAIPTLGESKVKIEGVIDSATDLVERMRPARLALIGGRRTVLSGVYRRAFSRRGIALEQRIAQPLSALIEAGDTSSELLREECRRILSPIKNCSHLLLACTHYPAITAVIKQYLSSYSKIVDPAEAVVGRMARWEISTGSGQVFLTSGDPQRMKEAAWNAWKVRLGAARHVDL